jgi:hypothetical protein
MTVTADGADWAGVAYETALATSTSNARCANMARWACKVDVRV